MPWMPQAIFSALAKLPRLPSDGDYRLTDCVHQLIRPGLRVESYQLYDQDEVQGINTAADLARAEFILAEAAVPAAPPGRTEPGRLRHRRLARHHRRRLHPAQRPAASARRWPTRSRASGEEKRGVIIGYDRRFLSQQAAEASAEVFAGNNIPTILLTEDAPTPLITYATAIAGIGLRPGVHRQPQSSRVERPEGLSRRRLAAARRRDAPDRDRDQRA